MFTSATANPTLESVLQQQGMTLATLFGFARPMRYREHVLEPGTRLYVLGTSKRREDGSGDAEGNEALVVQKEGRVPFILSDSDEQGVVRNRMIGVVVCLVLGLAAAGGGAYLVAAA